MNTFNYKNYAGSVEFDLDRHVLRGKLLCIDDLVTYQAETLPTLEKEFQSAVDDYLETCKEVGKRPQKSYNGLFNVRTGSELHKAAVIRSLKDEVSLNAVVVAALQAYVQQDVEVRHTHDHRITLVSSDEQVTSLSTVSAGQPMRQVNLSQVGERRVH